MPACRGLSLSSPDSTQAVKLSWPRSAIQLRPRLSCGRCRRVCAYPRIKHDSPVIIASAERKHLSRQSAMADLKLVA
jgi:hypothetical protein